VSTLFANNAKLQIPTVLLVKLMLHRTVHHVLKDISLLKIDNVKNVKITAKHVEVIITVIFVHQDSIWYNNKRNIQETVLSAMEIVLPVLIHQLTVSLVNKDIH